MRREDVKLGATVHGILDDRRQTTIYGRAVCLRGVRLGICDARGVVRLVHLRYCGADWSPQ